MRAIDKSYRLKAKGLKKLHLIDYDLRSPLSSQQKSRITVLAKTYGHVIKYPDKFHAATVGKERARELKNAGFKVTPKRRAFIPLHDYTSAKISKGKILLTAGRYTEKVILAKSVDFHKNLKKLTSKKMGRNQLITARLGNNNYFARSRFNTYEALYKYVAKEFQPKDKGASRQQLIGLMSVVTINNTPKNKAQNVKKNLTRK